MKNPLPLLLATLATALPSPCQTLPEGYLGSVRALPPGTTHALALTTAAGGGEVRFDGTRLLRLGPGTQRTLLMFPSPVFGSFLVQVDSARVLFGESSSGGVWLVPLAGRAPTQPLAIVPYNYDAAMLSPTVAVISARTGGFSAPDNDLIALDLTTGAPQQLAAIPGASGPVAVSGALYYATASPYWPTPPGQTVILRFDLVDVTDAILHNLVLGQTNAQVLCAGLDSASDLAIDQDGDLLFLDWYRNVIGELDDIDAANATPVVLVDYAGATVAAGGLQFVPSAPGAVFEPFQPGGGILRVLETDYVSTDQLRQVTTRPATLTSLPAGTVPAGPVSLHVGHGPSNGMGLIAFALAGPGPTTLVPVPGFEAPLHWQTALLVPANTVFVTFDASGGADLSLMNPGLPQAIDVLAQAAFVDAGRIANGASWSLSMLWTQ